jgi:hypothetical protein
MNCEIIQRRLLSIPDPERMPSPLRAHLAYCGACREWHEHLLLLERHIPMLPIPRSNGKANLMRRLLQEQAPPNPGDMPGTSSRSHVPTPSHSQFGTLLRSRTWLLGVAAALLLIALSWLGLQRWLQTTGRSPPNEPASGLAVFFTALALLGEAKSVARRRNADAKCASRRHRVDRIKE